MSILIINSLLILANGALALYNYNKKNYSAAMFSSFACGFIAAGLIAIALNQ